MSVLLSCRMVAVDWMAGAVWSWSWRSVESQWTLELV